MIEKKRIKERKIQWEEMNKMREEREGERKGGMGRGGIEKRS